MRDEDCVDDHAPGADEPFRETGLAKTTTFPDVHVTWEMVRQAQYVHWHSRCRCCKITWGTDVQSDEGVWVRCDRIAVVRIQLATGQHYDFCEECARHHYGLEQGKWLDDGTWKEGT